jgi:hypothetical protein
MTKFSDLLKEAEQIVQAQKAETAQLPFQDRQREEQAKADEISQNQEKMRLIKAGAGYRQAVVEIGSGDLINALKEIHKRVRPEGNLLDFILQRPAPFSVRVTEHYTAKDYSRYIPIGVVIDIHLVLGFQGFHLGYQVNPDQKILRAIKSLDFISGEYGESSDYIKYDFYPSYEALLRALAMLAASGGYKKLLYPRNQYLETWTQGE